MELVASLVSDLIGVPIISVNDGTKLGSVKDVLIDTDSLKATALLISGDSGRGGLAFAQVLAFGPDAITVKSAEDIFWASATSPGPARESNDIKGLPVVDASGTHLGNVHDISLYGDRVESIEVRSGGVLGIGATDTDIPVKQIRSIGAELVTVDALAS